MTAPWEANDAVVAAPAGPAPWEAADAVVAAPKAAPKRQVGIAEAGGRGVGSTLAGQGNTLALAAAAPAILVDAVGNLFRDKPSTAAQDFMFRNVVDPTREAQKSYAIDPATEQMGTGATIANVGGNLLGMAPSMVVGGAAQAGPKLAAMAPVIQNLVKGAVAAQPSFAVPSTVSRAQDLLESGVDGNTVAKASASNYLANTAMGALPMAKAGGVLTRAATGAGINAATGAAQRGVEAAILGDEYKAQQQNPFGGQEMGLDAGIGALMAAIMGPRAAAVSRPTARPDPTLAPGATDFVPEQRAPLPPDPNAALKAVTDALFQGDTSRAPDATLVPPDAELNIAPAPDPTKAPTAPDWKLEGEPEPAAPKRMTVADQVAQDDLAAATRRRVEAEEAFKMARGVPVDNGKANIAPDSQALPETKGGMQERKQSAQDEAAMTGEARNLSDASAGGATTREGTAATAPEEFAFLGVRRDGRGNITGTGPQVEVLERMTLQDPKGKPIEAVRVRMGDGSEEVLPANQVTTLSRPANPRFAQDNAASTGAPPRGVGTGPDQPAPRRAAQRITTENSPEFLPGERNARPDNGPNDGRANGERRPQTYDAEPRPGEGAAARLPEPARPDAAPDGAAGSGTVPPRTATGGPDAVPADSNVGNTRVADPREVPRLQVEYEKVSTQAKRVATRIRTLEKEAPSAARNDKLAKAKEQLERLRAVRKDIAEQLTPERIPTREAGGMTLMQALRKEGGVTPEMARDLGIDAKDPKTVNGKGLSSSDRVLEALDKHGLLEDGDDYASVTKRIGAELRGQEGRTEADLEQQARAQEKEAMEAEAKALGIDTRDMTRNQIIEAIRREEAKGATKAEQEAFEEAMAAAREEEANGRTIDDLLDEVGVTDKDIEDAKWNREREAESRAAANEPPGEAGGGEGAAPPVRESRNGQDEKRPDARPGGEQVDGGRGPGDGGAGEARPAAGEAGGEPAARADEANYRLNALPFDAVFRTVKKALGDGAQWKAYTDYLHELTTDLAKQLKKPGEALTKFKDATTTKSGENAAMAVIRMLNEDIGRRARIIVDKSGSETARKVLDMMDFELGKGEGTGKVFREAVQQRMGKSLNTLAAELEIVNGIADTMKKGGMGRKEAYAKAWEEVIKRVENPNLARQGEIGKAAAKVEAWLKGQRDMQVEAGVDIGDQGARYFPVKYDADKVQADRAGFERDIAQAYRTEGATAEEAKAQAKALADGLIRGESFSLVGVETGASASPVKERVFTKTETLNLLRKWRNLDGRDVLISYANSAARRAAIAERFGDNFGGKKDRQGKTITPSWKELVAKITDEGGEGSLPILRDLVELGTGVNQPRGTGAQYADVMRNAMTMSALEKSVLPNLMETVTPLATTNGSVAAGLSMLRTNIHGALAGLGVLPKSERRAAAQALLEGIGALSDIGSQQQAMARYSGHDAGKGGFSEAVGRFFEGIGLNKLTDAQRISTADIGAVWFDSLAKAVSGNAGWKSLTKGADAKHLRDMGIPADKVQAFAKFVTDLKGRIPTAAELGKAGEMGALYGDAITRFMNSTVQHGDALTRPSWASTPWGSLVFQFSSYTYAFHKNVVRRAFNNAMDAGNLKNDLTTADRLSLATGMLPGFMLMGAVSYLTMELRDEVFNEMAGTKKNLTDQAKKERAIQNANLFGKYGRVFEQFGQQRYGAGAAGLFVPPAIAQGAKGVDAFSQSVREGSDKNTGERKMAKWAYNTVLEPAWQIALSAGPGIPFGAASIAARTFAPSAAEGAFVDAVAGPANKRSEKPQKGVFE